MTKKVINVLILINNTKRGDNLKKHIFNAFKIATTAIIAILIAHYLSLDNTLSAGIVAILSIAATKKETILTATQRLIAFIIAILIAFIAFYTFGFGILGFYAYLLVYILICHKFKWYSSITMNSVLISHFLTFGVMSTSTVTNEALLFIIGVGCGIISNLHLKQNKAQITKLQQECDLQIQLILKHLSAGLGGTKPREYDCSCFAQLEKILDDAKNVAKNNYLNQFSNKNDDDLDYLIMRETQIHVLKTICQKIGQIHKLRITSKTISKFLEQMSDEFHKDNDGTELKQKASDIYNYISNLPLPNTREEFEDRAILFSILNDIEEVIMIKLEYRQSLTVK